RFTRRLLIGQKSGRRRKANSDPGREIPRLPIPASPRDYFGPVARRPGGRRRASKTIPSLGAAMRYPQLVLSLLYAGEGISPIRMWRQCPMFLGHITGEPMKQGVQDDGPARVPSIRGLIVTPTLARFVLSEIAYDLWVTHSAERGNEAFLA